MAPASPVRTTPASPVPAPRTLRLLERKPALPPPAPPLPRPSRLGRWVDRLLLT